MKVRGAAFTFQTTAIAKSQVTRCEATHRLQIVNTARASPHTCARKRPLIQSGGLVLTALGAVAAFTAQMALGASWRIGVDACERTALVTSGVFRLVRNPIFTAMITTFAGLALVVPNVVALTGAGRPRHRRPAAGPP